MRPQQKSNGAKIIKLADKTAISARSPKPAPTWSVKRRLDYVEWAKQLLPTSWRITWLEGQFDHAAQEADRSINVVAV